MLIEINEVENCKFDVECHLDPDQVSAKRVEVTNTFRKGNVPGFRPGKATFAAAQVHFKRKIDEATKEELARQAVETVIAEKNLKPLGQPTFKSIQLDHTVFKCNFTLSTVPNITLNQYKGFDLPKGHNEGLEEVSARIMQEVRQQHGTTVPFGENDFVQEGDSVIVSYLGTITGEELPTLKKEGEIFIVGDSPLPAFNENLLGMKVGERREFLCTLPTENLQPHLAGKEVSLQVDLNMASKNAPAALDDELAQKVGLKTINELSERASAMASNHIERLQNKHLTTQVVKRLMENHQVEIPDWLTIYEAQLVARYNGGHDWDKLTDEVKSQFLATAQRNIILSLILDKVRENEPDAQMSDEEVFAAISSNISQYKQMFPQMVGRSDQEVLDEVSKAGFLPALISSIKDDYAIGFIIKNSQLVE